MPDAIHKGTKPTKSGTKFQIIVIKMDIFSIPKETLIEINNQIYSRVSQNHQPTSMIDTRSSSNYDSDEVVRVKDPSITVFRRIDHEYSVDPATLYGIHLHDGIQEISESAFNGCCKLTTFRMPPLISRMSKGLFGYCNSLVSIEVSESTITIEGENEIVEDWSSYEYAHQEEDVIPFGAPELRNIAFSSDADIRDGAFEGCCALMKIFGSHEAITNALKHRFDYLPIHKMLYYQSYNPVTTDQLIQATKISSSHPTFPTNTQQDCLGMTLLHVLACSTVQKIEFYKVLISKYPEQLITEDKWGALPLLYALWTNAPVEILDYLVESYKTHHPHYIFEWTGMMVFFGQIEAQKNVCQNLVDVSHRFPDQSVDWGSVWKELLPIESGRGDVLEDILMCCFSRRIDALRVKYWRQFTTGYIKRCQRLNFPCFEHLLALEVEIGLSRLESYEIRIDAIGTLRYIIIEMISQDPYKLFVVEHPTFTRTASCAAFRAKVDTKLSILEAEYQKLKDATSTLELALWKKKMNEQTLPCRLNKKIRIDESAHRRQCRVNCGADVLIGHVLPYLLPVNEFANCDSESSRDDESGNESD